jgi:predicted nuclease with RNAse H fold
MQILGIDYGSKLAGTTAITYLEENRLQTTISRKGQDADALVCKLVKSLLPEIIAIDAPLSVPAGIINSKANNYFYRKCDKELQAMSPMFLGGLTARALKLKDQIKLEFPHIKILETYPKAQWRRILPDDKTYKTKNEDPENLKSVLIKELAELELELEFELEIINNWHCFDSILCWIGGSRYAYGKSLIYGKEEEGLIYV